MGKSNGVQVLPSPQKQAQIENNAKILQMSKQLVAQGFTRSVMEALEKSGGDADHNQHLSEGLASAFRGWLMDHLANPFFGLAVEMAGDKVKTKWSFLFDAPRVVVEELDIDFGDPKVNAIYSGRCLTIRLPIGIATRVAKATDRLIRPDGGRFE